MAKNNSIVLDIGAKIDKTWQASLNNIGTDLKSLGRVISNNMHQYNDAANSIDKYSEKTEQATQKIKKFEEQLKELDKIEESVKSGNTDVSILSDRDKRGIMRRAKDTDFINVDKIKEARDTLAQLEKIRRNLNTNIGKKTAHIADLEAQGKLPEESKLEVTKLQKELEKTDNKIIETETHLKSLLTFENLRKNSPLITGRVLDRIDEARPRAERGLMSNQRDLDAYNQKLREAETQTEQSLKNMAHVYKQYLVGEIAKAVQNVIGVFAQLGKVATRTLSKMFGVFSKTVTSAIGLQQAIKLCVQYGFGFRSLYYLVRRVRTGIEQGFEYLGGAIKSSRKAISGFSEEVGKLLETIKELMFYLKSAAAAMLQPFMPLINSIIPKLVEWFNALAIAVANFIATLTGQSKIYVASTNLEDYANALDQVAGSADKAKEALGAYDKLNVIHKDKNGGGGTNLDTSGWFKEQPVEPSDLAKMIKEAWEKADFTQVGIVIGEKFKAMLEGIDWDGTIFPMIEKIAKSVATFINGFVSVDGLGAEIGKTIANVFNGITDYVLTFASTLDWSGIGKFIVEGINKFLTTFDAAQLGASLHTFFDGFLTVIGTVLSNIDSKQLGENIGNFFQNLDLGDLASKLVKLVGKFVVAFAEALGNWAKTDPESFGLANAIVTASALTKLVKIAIPIALSLGQAGVLDFSGIFTTLKEKIAWSFVGDGTMAKLLSSGFVTTLTNVFSTIGSAISPLIGPIALLLGAGLVGEIANSWDEGLTPLQNILVGLGNAWDNLYYNIIEPTVTALKSVALPIWDALKEAFVNVASALGSSLIPVCQLIADVLSNQVFPILKRVIEFIGTIVGDYIVPVVTAIITTVSDALAFVIDVISMIIRVISPFIQYIVNTVGPIIVGVIDIIVGAVEFFGQIWSDAWNGARDLLKSVVNSIIGFLNRILSAVGNTINGLIDTLNGFSIPVPGWVTALTGAESFGFNINHVNIPQIPTLAQGAVIPPNRQFLAMLGDQSSGTNIEAPLDTIKQALVEALAESSANAPIVLQLDGKVIAKTVWDENEKRYKQLGKYAY